MAHDPLSPSHALRTPVGISLFALSLLAFAYSIVIVGQLLVGLWFVAVVLGTYPLYRLIVVLDSFADAAQRLAAVREHEADVPDRSAPSRTDGDVDPAGRDTDSSWGTERER
ncbi:hypothetical protein [Halorubrum sp. DTA98]|uniref:hypothetical protein n=1 Tax=Halorubrum sp. DTA98 TaxID=3402163 RepID=UPI003AAB8FE5